jgi:dTDP-4-amino-4,6-dideoxygalactose transaminase
MSVSSTTGAEPLSKRDIDARAMIPVMKPLLPPADSILPYLREIDANRWYSNFGPLAVRFEARLAALFGLDPGQLLTVSNGTSALTVLLRAMDLEVGTYCIMPSWTFAATAAAAIEAGLTPYFLDIDETSWCLEPDAVIAQLPLISGKVSAVITVATFGAPIEAAAWDAFTSKTGIRAVIDAAAAFDTLLQLPSTRLGNTPVMVSLHATKTFGIGEGAMVTSNDTALLQTARQLCNFGFGPEREIVLPGSNSKLSEYSAAVGLAGLDEWPDKRARWGQLTRWYLEAFEQRAELGLKPWLNKHWVSSVCNVYVPSGGLDGLIAELSDHQIEARRWWVKACHQQPAYSHHPRLSLPVTEQMVRSVLALPFSVDMTQDEVSHVVDRLTSLCSSQ